MSRPAANATGRDEAPTPTLVAPLVEETPVVDGKLGEEVWKRAALADSFIQSESSPGQPATQRTEVRIAHTPETLLIGARLYDPEPHRIVATEFRRDSELEAIDAFEVFLDTFRDRRNAFYFATNAAGAQVDALVRNEGEAFTPEWDGVWYVASARDEEGWAPRW